MPPQRVIESLHPEMVGTQFGLWSITNRGVVRKGKEIAVYCRCQCGDVHIIHTQNLLSGKSQGCRSCASKRLHVSKGRVLITGAAVLRVQKRCNSMRQRCENPNDLSYHNYGARGIQFRFANVSEAIAYILLELPHDTYLRVDIDRIDNDGHYEKGNLRLATRAENLANRSRKPTT